MTQRPPAEVGMPLAEVDTPALLIELDAFERNLSRMAQAIAPHPVRLRAHAKTHKCPTIARRQIALGAVGVCCQKVGEAEALVAGGVEDVLVTNEIVGEPKLRRLAALARQARIGVCVDDAENVAALGRAAQAFGAELRVLVEVNVGADRCGVEPGAPALALARRVTQAPGLRFDGLQVYHGSAQHLRSHEERRRAIEAASAKARDTQALLEREGIACPTITGAGTGTFRFEAAGGLYTELQAGSYIFMDADYGKNRGEDGGPVRDFEHSLFVYATVMSHTAPERAVVDAGLKALSVDSGMPLVFGLEGVEYARASDEHGKLVLAPAHSPLRVGQKLRLIPGHCDPTVNLYDWFVCTRNDRVEALWPITARGALL
ncbi:MAG: DSD1 family PLP-dependent enzyme [Candidatus Lambdaproteobacteria bacterium]|nr:DSD1 family PLP-dependent enzyme [Candidatus Lambdaproteobacteria bacterium]